MKPTHHNPGKVPPGITPEIAQEIITQLQALPPQYIPEVRHFIDFLQHRYRESEESLAGDYMRLSSESLRKIWDNDEDAIYDKL